MAHQNSMLSIMNAALMAEGQEEIQAIGEGSLEERTLFRNWPLIVEAELEDSNYFFTRQQHNLITRQAGQFGFTDAYLVPDPALHVRKLWITDELGQRIQPDWIQDASYVYVNSTTGCFVETLETPDESLWTASFSLGIQKRLQALILRAFKEEGGEADRMEEKAEMQLQRARTASSKSRRPKKPYRSGPLAESRKTPRWPG